MSERKTWSQRTRYVKIHLKGGSSYIQPLDELAQALNGEFDGADAGTEITLTLIDMLRSEYEKLPEFTGH